MTTKINNVHSLLITEIIKERINQMMSNNEHSMHILFEIKDLLAELKGQEIKNIEAAFREGYMTTDRWSLELEVFDHIKMRYDQDTMTYDEYDAAKRSANFFRTNFGTEEVTNG
jgi:hypothetical protein